ncbi:ABC-2 transporter permease [Floricoccus penangensis]|uniref:ABC-2 transporter permease n=1 Tax=Floricoccus penangensis TaxID=1859475 RepID=UPI00204060E2|nr:ABC-2 transporter permease [Floricoccus penangensis]URZ88061.1 ABC-2 transporter permease [Floricoccus penangensis]
MKGVIAKDLYEVFGIRKNLRSFLSTYVALIFTIDIGKSLLYPILISTVIIPSILTTSLIQTTSMLDEKYDYSMYQIPLPVSRKDIISAKYLMGIIFILFNSLLLFLLLLTRLQTLGIINLLLLVFISMILSIYSLSISYPSIILLKNWGMVPMLITLGVGLIIYLVFPIQKIIALFKSIVTFNIITLSIISVMSTLALLFASYILTKHFYSKKEFN